MKNVSIAIFCIISIFATNAFALPHPSVISTQSQLTGMRNAIITNSVARAGWDKMISNPVSSLNYVHNPQATVYVTPSGTNPSEDAWRDDGHAARSHALQWVITGNVVHRDKALAILNDWGHTFQQIELEGGGYGSQIQLESAWALPVWISAADIMRYYNSGEAGWDPADIAAFDNYMNYLYTEAYKARTRTNNWGVSASLTMMAYGAWTDDVAIFEEGLYNQILLLDVMSETDGSIAEVCRDTWHPQYSIVSWTDAAELAYNVGYDDVYTVAFDGQTIPRLAVILEYFAKMMLGHTGHPCGDTWGYDYVGQYSRFDNYEVPYQHYINRVGAAYLPNFQDMVENDWRSNPGEDGHFLLWSRVTHGQVGPSLPLPFYDGFSNCFENWIIDGAFCSAAAYEGDVNSAKMSGTDVILTGLSTLDYSNILVSYARNTQDLTTGDAFISEWYDGNSWHTIENLTSGFSGWTLVSQAALPSGASHNPDFLIRFHVNSGSRFAYIDAVNVEGTFDPDTTPPAAPEELAATVDTRSVILDWADNTESDLAGYHIYRGTVPGPPYTQIASKVISSGYEDNTVTDGTLYYYTVTAVDISGNESDSSNEISVTVPVYPVIHSYSSTQVGNEPPNLLDGDPNDTSRWSAETFPQWVIIDYKTEKWIRGTRLWTYQDRAYQFTVEASDTPDSGYTTIVDRSANTDATQPISDDFTPVKVRYVKITVTGASGYTGAWCSLTEFAIIDAGLPGNLTDDNRVDLYDMAELGREWQMIYSFDALIQIAENWLLAI